MRREPEVEDAEPSGRRQKEALLQSPPTHVRPASLMTMCKLCCAGPERRKLKIKDAERYGWQPKEMLAEIASIYVHLGRADQQAIFARAIANDERSFRQEMFAEASKV